MGHYKDLIAFKKAYELAMLIYEITKKFPEEEKYSLISQLRRSSRSVCANLAEAYQRRTYRDYFLSKLNDSQTENTETEVWLNFSKDCRYISQDQYDQLLLLNTEVGKLIFFMLKHPDKFRNAHS